MYIYLNKKFTESTKYSLNHIIQTKHKHISILISGGQDSLCLIKIIEDIKKNSSISLNIQYIYIDHQWRRDSKKQIKHIINYIKSYNSMITIYEIKQLFYSEAQARKLRYQIINYHIYHDNNNLIITGHSLTDKIETFFNNLFRGTSIDGATSLTRSRYINNKIKIIRPLLNLNRYDIQWFCRHFCLPIWSDSTNIEYTIKRNRIRHELIPYLKNYFFAKIESNINQFLNISLIENEYIKQNTIKIYLYIRHQYKIAINYKIIKSQHIAIQKRIIQLFYFHHFNLFLTKTIIKKIIFFINNTSCNHKILYNNKTICLNETWIYFI
uniref:tRNA(Ile)-lysidine synthase n=1 Tax=Antithamnionella ternifolia TaxID=207919 RepID=A0A4D6WMD7_9FLOR|nr:tRNA Ile-lysidine synthetase [Antithamnionella ternifolia]